MHRFFALLLACLVITSSCSGERPTLDESAAREVPVESVAVDAPADPVIVRLAVPTGWSLDPADAGPASVANRVIADLLYEGLTSLDAAGVAQPAMATQWFVSDDRLTWTFVLDDTFVDGAGERFTARDAKRSLERVGERGAADQAATALMSITGWADFLAGESGGVSGISAPDETTLVIQLDSPDELLLGILASPAFGLTGDVDDALRTTGAFAATDDPGRFDAVDASGPVEAIELVTHPDGPAGALAAGEADWAVLNSDESSAGLDADIIRQPLDMQLALVARYPTADERLGVMSAVSPLLLANSLDGLTARPVPAPTGEHVVPAAVTLDVPTGELSPLGDALAAQLADAGIEVETVRSTPAEFATRVVTGQAQLFPVVTAGGTGLNGTVLRIAAPGATDDVFGPAADSRTQLAAAVRSALDSDQRGVFADALERELIDDGLLLPLGRFEVRIALSHRLNGLLHRDDGTLDLADVEIADS